MPIEVVYILVHIIFLFILHGIFESTKIHFKINMQSDQNSWENFQLTLTI